MLLASVSQAMPSAIHVLQCSIVHCHWLYGSSNVPLSQPNPDVGVMSQQLQTRVELNSQIYQLTKEITENMPVAFVHRLQMKTRMPI